MEKGFREYCAGRGRMEGYMEGGKGGKMVARRGGKLEEEGWR